MSVINRVLQDLDRQGVACPSLPQDVRPVGREATFRYARLPGLMATLLIMGVGAWWLWPRAGEPQPPTAVHTVRATPSPLQPDRSAAIARKPEQAPTPASPATAPPADKGGKAVPGTPPPLHADFTPRLDTHLSEPGAQAHALVVKTPTQESPAEKAQVLWQEATALLEQGRGQDARPLLEQALRLDPGHRRVRQTLVVLALEHGQRDEAEVWLREGMRLHPDTPWFALSLARLQLQKGNLAQAAELLEGVVSPRAEAETWALYASILARLGRPEATVAAYREALQRDPGKGVWWIGLGLALEQAGQGEEAHEAFSRALQTPLSTELAEYARSKMRR